MLLEGEGRDILTDKDYQAGDKITLDKAGVAILWRRKGSV